THGSSTSDVLIGMLGGGVGAILANRLANKQTDSLALQHRVILVDEKQVAEWRKHYRRSIRAPPLVHSFSIAVCLGLFCVNLIVSIPTWLGAIVTGIAALSTLGEAINVIYLRRKLDRLKQNESS